MQVHLVASVALCLTHVAGTPHTESLNLSTHLPHPYNYL